jgi:hypothetical protein
MTKTISITSTPRDLVPTSRSTPFVLCGIQLCPEIRMDIPYIVYDGNKVISKFPTLKFTTWHPFMFSFTKVHTSKFGWTLDKVVKTFENDFKKRLFSRMYGDSIRIGDMSSVFVLVEFELENNQVTARIEI